MKFLITGGCGYKGSVLVPKLLDLGHEVIVHDIQWFGSNLKNHSRLKIYKTDIREINKIDFEGVSTFIHLANVANDPSVELNPLSSWEINVLASQQILDKAIKQKVNHVIFASSGSVYGVKKEDKVTVFPFPLSSVEQLVYASSGSVYGVKVEEKVTEDLELVPISVYNKTKMVAERVFLSYSDKAKIHCLRPATVCGLSPRMRLDVAVNLLTFQAVSKKQITVLGGDQVRPNIHIDDIADLYIHLINNKDNIDSGCFNAGFENITIKEIANLIQRKTNCSIEIKPSNDPRSYRQDSTKILKTGFKPKKSVEIAITEIIKAFKNGKLEDDPAWHTVKCMKENNFK